MIAAVLGASALSGKYPRRNWEKGLTVDQLCGSLERHFLAWKQDQTAVDLETGFPESWMILCNAAMLATLDWRANGDWRSVILRPTLLMRDVIEKIKRSEENAK